MQRSDSAYLSGATGVLLSRALSVLAGVASLWVLTQVLSTEAFAGYTVAMSILMLAGYSTGLGLERSMLLTISELPPRPTLLQGRGAMLKIAAVAASVSTLTALVVWGLADPETGGARDEFLQRLAPIVPSTALSLVMITWFQANHRVGVSQSMLGLNDGMRCLLFLVCMVLGSGPGGIALAAVLASLVPIMVLSWLARGRSVAPPTDLRPSDVRDGLQFLVQRLSLMGLHHLDIIVLGALGTAVGTAQYVVASRFAMLLETAQMVFVPTFAPRVRRYLANGDIEMAAREYKVARVLGFTGALAIALVFVLAGPWILTVFGDFGDGFGAFSLILAAYVLPVGAGMHGTFLAMTNRLRFATLNRAICTGFFLVLLLILVPSFDAMGAGAALVVAIALHEVTGVFLLRRFFGLQAISALEFAETVLASATLILVAAMPNLNLVGAVVLACLLAARLLRERALLGLVLGDLLRLVVRRS